MNRFLLSASLIACGSLLPAGCVTQNVPRERTVVKPMPGTVDVDRLFTSQVTPGKRQQIEQMILSGGLGHPDAQRRALNQPDPNANQAGMMPPQQAYQNQAGMMPPQQSYQNQTGMMPPQQAYQNQAGMMPQQPYGQQPGTMPGQPVYQANGLPPQPYPPPGQPWSNACKTAPWMGGPMVACRPDNWEPANRGQEPPPPESVHDQLSPMPSTQVGSRIEAPVQQPELPQEPAIQQVASRIEAPPPPPARDEAAEQQDRRTGRKSAGLVEPPPVPRRLPAAAMEPAPVAPVPMARPRVALKGTAARPGGGLLAILDIEGAGVRFLREGQAVDVAGPNGPITVRVQKISRDAVFVDVGNVSEVLR